MEMMRSELEQKDIVIRQLEERERLREQLSNYKHLELEFKTMQQKIAENAESIKKQNEMISLSQISMVSANR